jgi:DNA topoisomerase-1
VTASQCRPASAPTRIGAGAAAPRRPGATSDAAETLGDPVAAARAAHLHYVNDDDPGISRRRVGTGSSYRDPVGRRIHDPRELKRIRAIVVPPAWTDVWICPDPNGHIQATGRDARGRKVYRYHERWRAIRDSSKYDRMLTFADALPRIRSRVQEDLALRGLPRDKVLATVISLLEATLIRVGNEEYARSNRSYGLTTMRYRHVDVEGSRMRFEFKGKSGKQHSVAVTDRRLARIVKQCQELPGQHLFQYVDEGGERHSVDSSDVNEYIREAGDDDFTAKDYRTWMGTVLAAEALEALSHESPTPNGDGPAPRPAKRDVVAAIEEVARTLGNTAAVCRRCYVHPAILDAYLEGSVIHLPTHTAGRDDLAADVLRPAEKAVLKLLRKRARDAERATTGAA